MIVAGSASPLLLASAAGGYNLTNSLRFRGSASASLTRTPASSGNKRTFTYSGWVKRGSLTGAPHILSATDGTTTDDYFRFTRTSDDCTLNFASYDGTNQYRIQSTAVYRDPSAWYHIVLRVDTTQATESNRYRIYVNGIQITSFSFATYPPQNYELTALNNNVLQRIGSSNFDGYMTEVNFIDGQSLDPSSFGENNEDTGVWQPKKYAGSYGTNGFYLPFTDNTSLTTSSNVGLGKDFSGNGNYWTTNNISLTAGVTYDSMTDVPTLTSATAANFATLNPISNLSTGSTITNGNLQVVTATGDCSVPATIGMQSSGKYYAEFVKTNNTNCSFGLIPTTYSANTAAGLGANSLAYKDDGTLRNSGSSTSSWGATYANNDVMAITFDASAGTVDFYKNNVKQGSTITGFTSGPYVFCVSDEDGSGGITWQANFGQRPFAYTPPTGFVALNTFNLPTPTIGATATTQANKYINATTYTGNGGTQSVTNSGAMQPDFVWIKIRSESGSNYLVNSVMGRANGLSSNSSDSQYVSGDTDLTSFNSNGFTVRDAAGQNFTTNESSKSYVAWQWRASNATAVTNTAGSITSTVSANTSAGFSVVTYAGNQLTSTIGHGLGVAPKMIIVKNRTGDNNWIVYHNSIGASNYLRLNLTNASASTSLWNNTAPTSSVYSVIGDSDVNGITNNYVAYCFSEVAGYSKIGSYTGNGSADGTFVYTGFRPAFVMVKQSSGANDWAIFDSKRLGYNDGNNWLYPNTSGAEASAARFVLLSNGFKLITTSSLLNSSGATYIYMAVAENPFKYSLAR
jgi:hypothetical protein